jgi:hypothetical protein
MATDLQIARAFLSRVLKGEDLKTLTINVPYERWTQLVIAEVKRQEAEQAAKDLKQVFDRVSRSLALFLQRLDNEFGLARHIDVFNDTQEDTKLIKQEDGYIRLVLINEKDEKSTSSSKDN